MAAFHYKLPTLHGFAGDMRVFAVTLQSARHLLDIAAKASSKCCSAKTLLLFCMYFVILVVFPG